MEKAIDTYERILNIIPDHKEAKESIIYLKGGPASGQVIDLDEVDSRQQISQSPYGQGRGATPPHRQSNNPDHLTPTGQRYQPPHDQNRPRGYDQDYLSKTNPSSEGDRNYNDQRNIPSNDNSRRGHEDEKRGYEPSSGRHQNEDPRSREYDGNAYNREEEKGVPIHCITGETRVDDDRLSGEMLLHFCTRKKRRGRVGGCENKIFSMAKKNRKMTNTLPFLFARLNLPQG